MNAMIYRDRWMGEIHNEKDIVSYLKSYSVEAKPLELPVCRTNWKLKLPGFLIRSGFPKSSYWEVTDCVAKNDDRAMSYYMEIVEDKAESGFEVSYLDLHGTTPPKNFTIKYKKLSPYPPIHFPLPMLS